MAALTITYWRNLFMNNLKYLLALLFLFTPLSYANIKLDNQTVYLSILEGEKHNQRHYSLGFMMNNHQGKGYVEVGLLDSLNNNTEFERYGTLAAGYNWTIYKNKYTNFYVGAGAIAAFKGQCNETSLDREKREFCAEEKNKDGLYGKTDLLLYPEARLSFNISKRFDMELNIKKLFSINDSFNPDKYFVGMTFSFELQLSK
jgi:hypothetical protein